MYAIELSSAFQTQLEALHPKRYKQITLRIFRMQENPHPPDAQMLEINIYRVRVGPYRITYEIDDRQRHVLVFLLEEMEGEIE